MRSCLLRDACLLTLLLWALPALARPLADIIASRELRVCLVSTFAAASLVKPAGCHGECKFSGAIPEQVQLFAKGLPGKVNVKTLRVEIEELFYNKEGKTLRDASYTPHLIESGRCDVYPDNLTKNAWRQKKLDFITLFPSRMMVMTQQQRKAEFKKESDLAGKRVAVERDSSFHTWLEQQNLSQFALQPVRMSFQATSTTINAVLDGTADFALIDADQAVWLARQHPGIGVAFPVGPIDEIGWAVSKQDQDLRRAINMFFMEQKQVESSALNAIWKKYFGLSLNKFIALVNSAG